jgi:hypothetical protein
MGVIDVSDEGVFCRLPELGNNRQFADRTELPTAALD